MQLRREECNCKKYEAISVEEDGVGLKRQARARLEMCLKATLKSWFLSYVQGLKHDNDMNTFSF